MFVLRAGWRGTCVSRSGDCAEGGWLGLLYDGGLVRCAGDICFSHFEDALRLRLVP